MDTGSPPKEPGRDGDTPSSGGGADDPGHNRTGGPPPEMARRAVTPGDDRERWGDLPVHVRDLFRSQGRTDLPPRYRDWIDAYHRRLNERR